MPKKLLSLSLLSLLGIAVLGTIAEADQRAANTLIPMVYANSTWSAPSSTMSQVTVDPSSTRFLRPMEVVLGTTIQPRQHTYIQCWGSDTGAFRLRTPELEANQDAQYHIYSFTGNEYPLDGPYFISVGLYNAAPISVGQAYQRLVAENGELVSFDRSRLHYVYIHDNTPLTFKCGEGFGIEVEPEVCGDGQVTGNESCDDTNTDNGDGCSSSCAIESGYSCNGEPSQCSRLIPTIGTPVGTSTSAPITGQSSSHYDNSYPASASASPPSGDMIIHSARIAGKYLYVQYTKEFDACTRLHKNGRVDMGVNLICDRGVRKANVLALASFRDAPGIGDNVKFCDFVGRGACSNEVRVTNLQGSATTTSTATSFSTSSHYDASYPSSTSASQVGNMELHSAKIIGQYLYMNYTKPFAACATLHRNGRSDKGPNFVCKAGSKLDQVLALQSFELAPKVGESIHFCDFVYRSSCSNKLTVAGSVGVAKPEDSGREAAKGYSSTPMSVANFYSAPTSVSYIHSSAPMYVSAFSSVNMMTVDSPAILHSAKIIGDNLEVVYTKYFSACMALFHQDGAVDRGGNFLCDKGGKVKKNLPLVKFGKAPNVGEHVTVCDFAYRSKCSNKVQVTAGEGHALKHKAENDRWRALLWWR